MKSGTPSHIKTKRFKRRMGLPLYQAAGILEMVWQLTGDCADDGAIGRHSNEDIAAYLEWEGDPDELIAALVDCGWLDVHPVSRLVVHDWEDHRPHYIKERQKKRQQRHEITTYDKKTGDSPGHFRDSPQDSGDSPGQNGDCLTQPNQSKPKPTKAKASQANQSEANPSKFGSSNEEPCADESARVAGPKSELLPNAVKDQIREVFKHYQFYHPRAFPKVSSKLGEWNKVRDRLLHGFTVDQLKTAIDGCHRSPWHCGENPGGKLYQSLELIMRDATHVNQFLEVPQRGQGPPVLSERTMRGNRAAESFLQRRMAQGNGNGHQPTPGICDGHASPGGDVQS